MEFSEALVCVLFSTLAVSYAWGMRGSVIGGEKGAMLPGLYLGLILAWFAGGGIREYFWIPAAAGLMGMSFGGTEPYGDTIHMVICRTSKHYRPVRGYTGLAVKGGLWFGVAGGFIAFALSAMGGLYTAGNIVIFCVLIPVFQLAGYLIFNQPYNEEKGKYPAIYFSFESREEWGSNLMIMLALLAMGIIKHDDLLVNFVSLGFVFGFIGWLIAIKFYDLSQHPLKNGKYIFGKLVKKDRIDGWKIMEFTLGAIGGMGIAIAFCASDYEIRRIRFAILQNGLFNPIAGAERFMPLIIGACALAIIGINFYEFYVEKKGGEYNGFICDIIERPLFNLIPMVFVLLGSVTAARLMTVFMIIFVCGVKCVFDRFEKDKTIIVPVIVFSAAAIAVFVIDLVKGGFTHFDVIIAGGFPYLAAELWFRIAACKKKGKSVKDALLKDSFSVVFSFMIIQVIAITLISAKLFLN